MSRSENVNLLHETQEIGLDSKTSGNIQKNSPRDQTGTYSSSGRRSQVGHVHDVKKVFHSAAGRGEALEDHVLLPMNENIFSRWSALSFEERLPYLLDSSEVYKLLEELKSYEDVGTGIVSRASFYSQLEEFQAPESIRRFWDQCDENGDNFISVLEYVICRGDHDRYGNPSNSNEYEHRANTLLLDYETQVRSSSKMLPGFKYDENGIIIDDP